MYNYLYLISLTHLLQKVLPIYLVSPLFSAYDGVSVFLHVIGQHVAGQVVHPGAKLAVGRVGVTVFQHAVKHILHQVFAGVGAAQHVVEKAKELAVVALKEQPHPVHVAGFHPQHQCIVR